MANIGRLNVQVGVDLNKFRADMKMAFNTLNSTVAKMNRSLNSLTHSFKDVNRAVGSLNRTVGLLAGGWASIQVLRVGKDVLMAADAFNQLQAKIRNSVDASTSIQQVFDQIVASSNKTGTSIESVAQAFVRIRPAALQLGKTNEELIQFNETFQKMGVLAGATSIEMKQTMIQLSQAIASNRLSGDELRSVLEQMPSLARTIADAMKIAPEALKAAAKDGKITAEAMFNAVMSKVKETDEAFAKLPPSVERSMNRLVNHLTLFWAEVNRNALITNAWAKALDGLADFLKDNREKLVKLVAALIEFVHTVLSATKDALIFAATLTGDLSGAFKTVTNWTLAAASAIDLLVMKIKLSALDLAQFAITVQNLFTHPLDFEKAQSATGKGFDIIRSSIVSETIGKITGRHSGKKGMGLGTSTLGKSPYSGAGGDGKKKKGSDHDKNFIQKINQELQTQIALFKTLSTQGMDAYDKVKRHMEALEEVMNAHLKISHKEKMALVAKIELTEQYKEKIQQLQDVLKTERDARGSKGSLTAYLAGGDIGLEKFQQNLDIQKYIQDNFRNNPDAAKRYTSAQEMSNRYIKILNLQKSYNDGLQLEFDNNEALYGARMKGLHAFQLMEEQLKAEAEIRQLNLDLSDAWQANLANEIVQMTHATGAQKRRLDMLTRELEMNKEHTDTLRKMGAVRQGYVFNPQTHQFELKALRGITQAIERENKVLQMGIDLWSQEGQAMLQALKVQDDLSNSLDVLLTKQQQLMDAAQSMGQSFSDAFEGVILQTTSVRDAIRTLLLDIARMVYQQTAGKLISSAITGLILRMFGGGIAGGAGASVGGLAAAAIPGFASGGITPANRPFVVGEHGPELMMSPHQMAVMPNSALGGGPVINQYITINAIDSKSFKDHLYEHGRDIMGMALQGVQRQSNKVGNRSPLEPSRG